MLLISNLLITGCFSVSGQKYFENIVDIDTTSDLFYDVQVYNSDYYAAGAGLIPEHGISLLISKFNGNGNLLWSKFIGDSLATHQTSKIFIIEDTLYDFGQYRKDTGSSKYFALVKMDTNGNFISQTNFGDSINDNLLTYPIVLENGDFLLVGASEEIAPGTSGDIHVFRIDKNANVLWEQRYGEMDFNDLTLGAVELNNGDFMISGTSKRYNNEYHQYLFRINSEGGRIWDSLYVQTSDNRIATITKLNEHDIALVINGYEINSTTENISLQSVDGNGDLVWDKDYVIDKESTLGYALINYDGTITCYGSSRNSTNNVQGFMMKITPRGDTLWTRNYFGNNSTPNYIWSLKHTPDSGYVFVGSSWNSTSDGWIKKLDCMGCDSVQCYFPDSCFVYDCENDYPPIADFSLAQDTFRYKDGDTVSIKFENSSSASAAYTWFFDTGDSLNLVNPRYEFTQPGDYEITLVARNVTCTDTAKAILHIIDVAGIKELLTDSRLRVYPNPSTGVYNISLSPHIKFAGLVVTNLIGEMIIKKKISSNSTSFDLSGFSNGVYFVQISGNQQILDTVKIIKQ